MDSPSERIRLRVLRRSELPYDTVDLARTLIGALVVADAPEGRTVVRIVETEAYLPGDAAAHSFRGKTERNRTLFARRGHAYVYFIYGVHYCLNVSSERSGIGAGVLLRAGEPVVGLSLMHARRGAVPLRDVCRGPGRLAAALGIDRRLDGVDLTRRGVLWLAAPTRTPPAIAASRRIGLSKETERVLRFYEAGSRYVSGRLYADKSVAASSGES